MRRYRRSGRDPQRGRAVGWRADQPELGAIRNGALAESTGRMASAPGDSGPRSGYVRPLFEPSWRHGQSGSGEPRRGQCVSGSACRSPPRTGAPGQAIAWGAWSEIGEAAEQRERIDRQRSALGGRWFTPQQGLRAFDQLVRQDVTTSVVMSMDWSVFEEAVEDRPPFLEDLLSTESDDEADPRLRQRTCCPGCRKHRRHARNCSSPSCSRRYRPC